MPSCDGVIVTVDFVPFPHPSAVGIRPNLRAAAPEGLAPDNEVTTTHVTRIYSRGGVPVDHDPPRC